MVELHFKKGRFGNRLFRYAIARIIAEKLGYELNFVDPWGVTYFKTPNMPHPAMKNTAKKISGKSYGGPVVKYEKHLLDLDSIFADQTPRKIEIHGFFQRTEYYESYYEQIKEWFDLPESPIDVRENDMLLHIRQGDRMNFGNIIKPKYYIKCLEMTKVDRVFVIGDSIDPFTRNLFAKYNPIYPGGSIIDDFKLMKKFNKMVLSNSTFAWWAAYLSNASEIYYPLTTWDVFCPDYHETGQKLLVDKPEWKYIENVEVGLKRE